MADSFEDVTLDQAVEALTAYDRQTGGVQPLGTMAHAGFPLFLNGQLFQLLAYQHGRWGPGVAAVWRDHRGVEVIRGSVATEAEVIDDRLLEAFRRARRLGFFARRDVEGDDSG